MEVRRARVVAYDPAWRRGFEMEAKQITHALGGIVVAVHHIGSTAIPGIFAKPIIDLVLEVDDVVRLDGKNAAMKKLGYEVMGERGIPGCRYFRKHNASGVRTHHVHAFAAGSAEVVRHIAFRDYMIAHSEEAQTYSTLKQQLAHEHPYDTQAYQDGKDAFIK